MEKEIKSIVSDTQTLNHETHKTRNNTMNFCNEQKAQQKMKIGNKMFRPILHKMVEIQLR